jgi:TolB protein
VATRATSVGEPARISIAVVPFGLAPGSPPPPIDIARVISADLASSGRFVPMPAADMPSRPSGMAEIQYEEWRRTDTDYVVVGLVGKAHDGGHEVEFRLVDTRTKTSLVGFHIPSAPDSLQHTALEIAKMIQRRLAGET